MFDKLGSVLKQTMKKIASAIFLDKKLIDEIVKDLQRALLEADVDVSIVFELSEEIRKAAKESSELEKKEQIIALIHDKLVEILGKDKREIEIKGKPFKIMFLGLYGSGKTTTISKLANYYSKRGYKCAVLGLDVHRPAAPEQLEQLAKKVKVACFIDKEEKNALKVYKEFELELENYDIVFIDTAGRDALDKELVKELESLDKTIKPQEKILVMPGDIGQAAKHQAAEFKKSCNITGVILTRLDGTAKGGGALSACSETKAPVLFIGTGEKIADIETFNPTAFVGRLLGMGDLEALMEKAKFAAEKETKTIEEHIEEGKFTLIDMYEQLKTMQNMGPLNKIAELIPGLGKVKLPENLLSVQEEKMKKWKYAMDSMTKKEIEEPENITSERINRIAKGANVNASDVRDLLKQHKMIKKFIGSGMGAGMQGGFDEKNLKKLARRFGGRMRF